MQAKCAPKTLRASGLNIKAGGLIGHQDQNAYAESCLHGPRSNAGCTAEGECVGRVHTPIFRLHACVNMDEKTALINNTFIEFMRVFSLGSVNLILHILFYKRKKSTFKSFPQTKIRNVLIKDASVRICKKKCD